MVDSEDAARDGEYEVHGEQHVHPSHPRCLHVPAEVNQSGERRQVQDELLRDEESVELVRLPCDGSQNHEDRAELEDAQCAPLGRRRTGDIDLERLHGGGRCAGRIRERHGCLDASGRLIQGLGQGEWCVSDEDGSTARLVPRIVPQLRPPRGRRPRQPPCRRRCTSQTWTCGPFPACSLVTHDRLHDLLHTICRRRGTSCR